MRWPEKRTVKVFFTCGRKPEDPLVPVDRVVGEASVLRNALGQLLEGPSAGESARGLYSPFSRQASLLKQVVLVGETAYIDFSGDYRQINNINTSNEGGIALRQLNATAFQFPTVNQIVYQIEGSAEEWCNFYESVCAPATRP